MKETVGAERFSAGKFELAAKLFDDLITDENLQEFLTLIAYDHLD
jgi:malate synthase